MSDSQSKGVRPLTVPAKEAAAMIGVHPRTLANWRNEGIGPEYVRFGAVQSRVFYLVEDIEKWVKASKAETAASIGEAVAP